MKELLKLCDAFDAGALPPERLGELVALARKAAVKRVRETVKRRIPEDFVLTPERRQMAIVERLDPNRIDAIFARFRDHWLGNGELKVDWDATWRNWCRSPYQDNDRIEVQRGSLWERAHSVDSVVHHEPSPVQRRSARF